MSRSQEEPKCVRMREAPEPQPCSGLELVLVGDGNDAALLNCCRDELERQWRLQQHRASSIGRRPFLGQSHSLKEILASRDNFEWPVENPFPKKRFA